MKLNILMCYFLFNTYSRVIWMRFGWYFYLIRWTCKSSLIGSRPLEVICILDIFSHFCFGPTGGVGGNGVGVVILALHCKTIQFFCWLYMLLQRTKKGWLVRKFMQVVCNSAVDVNSVQTHLWLGMIQHSWFLWIYCW